MEGVDLARVVAGLTVGPKCRESHFEAPRIIEEGMLSAHGCEEGRGEALVDIYGDVPEHFDVLSFRLRGGMEPGRT